MPSSVVDVTVQLTPTTASTCLFTINNESESGSDADPSVKELGITGKTTIISVEPTNPPLPMTIADIAGDIPAGFVEQA
jgi:hypothetical protein